MVGCARSRSRRKGVGSSRPRVFEIRKRGHSRATTTTHRPTIPPSLCTVHESRVARHRKFREALLDKSVSLMFLGLETGGFAIQVGSSIVSRRIIVSSSFWIAEQRGGRAWVVFGARSSEGRDPIALARGARLRVETRRQPRRRCDEPTHAQFRIARSNVFPSPRTSDRCSFDVLFDPSDGNDRWINRLLLETIVSLI